jgi:quercetin dioxygenase-like cupin family protein
MPFRGLVVLVFLSLSAFTGPTTATSQDLVTVAPGAAKVEYEDARIRVVRLRIAPNASLPMHDRPARVVIPLTPNYVRISRADGTTSTTRTAADRVAWSEPTRRTVTNLADAALENIIVELKTATAPGNAAQPPLPAPPDYLADSRHRWLFENEYVRVYAVCIPPGETTEFHRHAYDAVSVFVSGGLVAIQRPGEAWGRAETIVPGVAFSADAKKPVVHRVRNEGTTDYRVVLVQFLR